MEGLTPICSYCGKFSKMVTGKDVYPHLPKLKHLVIYECKGCDARVGCHKGTSRPLGRLANEELRNAKSFAHNCFDDIWKCGHMSRGNAYAWLARNLGIKKADCHIGMFDVEMCKKAASISSEYLGDKLNA